jgi:hypothetical protein
VEDVTVPLSHSASRNTRNLGPELGWKWLQDCRKRSRLAKKSVPDCGEGTVVCITKSCQTRGWPASRCQSRKVARRLGHVTEHAGVMSRYGVLGLGLRVRSPGGRLVKARKGKWYYSGSLVRAAGDPSSLVLMLASPDEEAGKRTVPRRSCWSLSPHLCGPCVDTPVRSANDRPEMKPFAALLLYRLVAVKSRGPAKSGLVLAITCLGTWARRAVWALAGC